MPCTYFICGSNRQCFPHETALFFHDLTDREPLEYTVTVKTGYNPSKLKAEGVQVFTIKAELHGVGLTTAQTPFGHTVPVYDLERTICDLLRSRNNMEMQTFQGALKMYARRKDKDLRTLMRYAGMFRVEKNSAAVFGGAFMIKTAKAVEGSDPQSFQKKICGRPALDAELHDGAFSERISLSEYRDKFILKGGMLVAAMVGLDARSTMDLDATVKEPMSMWRT